VLIGRGELKDIMKAGANQGRPPDQTLADILKIKNRNTKYAVSTLGNFIKYLGNPETDAFTAGVTFYEGVMSDRNKTALPGQEEEPAKELKISDTALFREDRLVGWLDPNESRGLLWIRGEVKEGVLVVKDREQKITFEIFNNTTKLQPSLKDGRPVMQVEVKAAGNLGEVSPGIYQLDEDKIKEMEQKIGAAVAAQVLAAVKKAQALGSDVLGFAPAVHRSMPEQWNRDLAANWPEVFKTMEVNVKVDSRIKGIGLITTSVNPHKQ